MRSRHTQALLAAVIFGFACCTAGTAYCLPVERSYERVSPGYKGGFGATHIEAVAQNGNSVAYFSPGVFAGAPTGLSGGLDNVPSYVAIRGSSEWATAAFTPPALEMAKIQTRDVTPNIDLTMAFGFIAENSEAGSYEGLDGRFLLHETDASETAAGWPTTGVDLEALGEGRVLTAYEGASSDFCHILFENNSEESPLTEIEVGVKEQLYEDNGGCDGTSPRLQVVGLDNEGKLIGKKCRVELGEERFGSIPSTFNALSSDGSQTFFTTCINEQQSDHQLFVRLGGTRSVEVSKPISEAATCGASLPCPGAATRPGANFVGASEDGSRVYFITSAALTGETNDTSQNLFIATIGCPETKSNCSAAEREVTSLTRATRDPNAGENTGMMGVVRVSLDGSRVYFVASGNLLDSAEITTLESSGQAIPTVGADNLYVYDGTSPQAISFIGKLCTGNDSSGSVGDDQCVGTGSDLGLWTEGEARVQTASSDGRFLVFSTYAELTADDTDTARDVYRYDALTGALNRVSGGEDDVDANGNNDEFDALIHPGHMVTRSVRSQHEMDSRAISEDGSRIVFTSAEPLSHAASNGLENVYEWHELSSKVSEVSLISGGTSETPVEDAVISKDGENIFFDTTQGLLPGDTDGEPDIYDARVGGGFPLQAAPVAECEGEECRGPLSIAAPIFVPASVSQLPGGNFSEPVTKRKTTIKVRRPAAKKKKRSKKRSKASRVRRRRNTVAANRRARG